MSDVWGSWCGFNRGNLQTRKTRGVRRMAQNQNRSNHVRVDNLPPNMADCRELLCQLKIVGNVQVGILSIL